MEKILRKVKCSERLPTVKKRYCIITQGNTWTATFTPGESDRYWRSEVEYWYEEVDLSTIMAQSVADLFTEEDKQNYRKATEKAIEKGRKERYEKAMELINDNLWCNSLGDEHCYIKYIKEALKIAAGLQEE